MSIQDILRIVGLALLAGAAVLAGLAIYTYRVLDIRSVKDDLAGKRISDSASGAKARGGRHQALGASDRAGEAVAPRPSDPHGGGAVVSPPDTPGQPTPSQPLSDESTETFGQQGERPAPDGRAPTPPQEFRIIRKIIFAAGEKAEEE